VNSIVDADLRGGRRELCGCDRAVSRYLGSTSKMMCGVGLYRIARDDLVRAHDPPGRDNRSRRRRHPGCTAKFRRHRRSGPRDAYYLI
jgi:hypothetical protein